VHSARTAYADWQVIWYSWNWIVYMGGSVGIGAAFKVWHAASHCTSKLGKSKAVVFRIPRTLTRCGLRLVLVNRSVIDQRC
jgi:hypothetical protein